MKSPAAYLVISQGSLPFPYSIKGQTFRPGKAAWLLGRPNTGSNSSTETTWLPDIVQTPRATGFPRATANQILEEHFSKGQLKLTMPPNEKIEPKSVLVENDSVGALGTRKVRRAGTTQITFKKKKKISRERPSEDMEWWEAFFYHNLNVSSVALSVMVIHKNK